jgi:hypothetical protein
MDNPVTITNFDGSTVMVSWMRLPRFDYSCAVPMGKWNSVVSRNSSKVVADWIATGLLGVIGAMVRWCYLRNGMLVRQLP